jgi:hypothetical protein
MTFLSVLRKPKHWMATAAATAVLVGGMSVAPAEAAGRTVTVSFSNGNCSAGSWVSSVQFGAVPGITAVPVRGGNSANVQLLNGSRNVQFVGTIWCTKGWWIFTKTTPKYINKTVYVPGTAKRVDL